MENIGFKDFKT